MFWAKCDRCLESFSKTDYVMRAKNKLFHLKCFRCVQCDKKLVPGDEFALKGEGIFCKDDHKTTVKQEENNNNNNSGSPKDEEDEDELDLGDDEDLEKCDNGEKEPLDLEDAFRPPRRLNMTLCLTFSEKSFQKTTATKASCVFSFSGFFQKVTACRDY